MGCTCRPTEGACLKTSSTNISWGFFQNNHYHYDYEFLLLLLLMISLSSHCLVITFQWLLTDVLLIQQILVYVTFVDILIVLFLSTLVSLLHLLLVSLYLLLV